MKRSRKSNPGQQKAIPNVAESWPRPEFQTKLDRLFSGIPRLADKDAYDKFLFRYYDQPFEQADAEVEFVERRIHCARRLNELDSEAKTGRINGLRELA